MNDYSMTLFQRIMTKTRGVENFDIPKRDNDKKNGLSHDNGVEIKNDEINNKDLNVESNLNNSK